MKNIKGFTLIEILVATTVALIMVSAIYMAINSALNSSGGMERKVLAVQDVRGALELMAMEIRMASYNPTNPVDSLATIWRSNGTPGTPGVFGSQIAAFCTTTLCCDPSTCAVSPLCSWHGIQEATANSITIEMDIDGAVDGYGQPDGNGKLTEANEIIRYNYVQAGSERYITRESNCGGAQSFLGDSVASGNPRTVRVINADLNPQIPVFRYFDEQGTQLLIDTNAGNNTTKIPNIRMIEITLAVETDEINPDTKQRRMMIYSSRELLRNHHFSQ